LRATEKAEAQRSTTRELKKVPASQTG